MKAFWKSTFGLVAATMVLFSVIAVFVAHNTSALMVDEAQRTVRSVVKATTGRIDRLMTGVETAVANQKWIICEKLGDPDYMYRVTRELVENNEYISGSTVAFKPYYYKEKGLFFAPYTYVGPDGQLKSLQLGTDQNNYYEQGWYAEPMKTGEPYWSEPYFDEGGGNFQMCTFSLPIRDASTNICAIFTADLSLKQLTDHIASICPYPQSYAVMRSAKGALIVAPPKGCRSNDGDGKTITIRDQAEVGWTVEIVCPIEEILRGAQRLVIRIVIFSAFGLVMIFALSWFYTARLQRSTALRERMAGEIDTARNIQVGFLPADFPDNVYAVLRPAREVGGDLYDFIRRDDKLYFIIGDASGKGVPAALFSFMAGTVFRMACGMGLGPGEICGRINQSLSRNNRLSMFVTAFAGVLDLKTGVLEYGCAGHNPPIVIAPDGSAEFLKLKLGPPTGAVSGVYYTQLSTTLKPGSKILVYTDGVTEAERTSHEQFGEKRLIKYAGDHADVGIQDFVKGLLHAVDDFVAGAEQFDDITIMAIQL